MVKNKAKNFEFLFLGLVLAVCSCFWFFSNASRNHSDVMRRARAGNPNFGNSRVYDIAMLGSHDAMSDKINNNSPVDYGGDVPDLGVLARLSFVRTIIVNYCRTQSVGLGEQLRAGARYIDARITYKGGVFYGTHGLVSGRLDDYLRELITFLLDNPGEFVVFNIAQYTKAEGNTETQLAEYMQNVKVNRNGRNYSIYDFINYNTSRDFSTVTYNDVTQNGTKGGLVIISRCFSNLSVYNSSLRDYFKMKNNYAIWYNRSSASEILGMVDGQVAQYKGMSAFRCNGLHTTQDGKSIALHLAGSLIGNAASEHSGYVDNSHFDYWLSCTPIACFDEVVDTRGNFNDKVNDKILNYNLNLNKQAQQLKYNKLTNSSQLRNGMRIVIKEVGGVNGYLGNDFRSNQVGKYVGNQFVLNDNPNNMWVLKQYGNAWKIRMPNGKWLYRNLFGYLVTVNSESSAATFKFNFYSNGTARIYYDTYGMYMNGSKTLDLSRKYSDYFEIYA